MSARNPKVGTEFRSDDGVALVVTPDTRPVDALCDLLVNNYGGEWSPDNPAVVEAASALRVEVWRYCPKAQCEAEGWGDDYTTEWWGPDGAGKRSCHVVFYDGSVYDLGERLHEAGAA